MKKLFTKKSFLYLGGIAVLGLVAYASLSGQMTGSLSQGALTLSPTTATTTVSTTASKLTSLESYAKKAYQSMNMIHYILCGFTSCVSYMNTDITKYNAFSAASTTEARIAFMEQFKSDSIATFYREYSLYNHYNKSVSAIWDDAQFNKGLGEDSFGIDKYLTPVLVAKTDLDGRISALETFRTSSAATIRTIADAVCFSRYGLTSETGTCANNIKTYIAGY